MASRWNSSTRCKQPTYCPAATNIVTRASSCCWRHFRQCRGAMPWVPGFPVVLAACPAPGSQLAAPFPVYLYEGVVVQGGRFCATQKRDIGTECSTGLYLLTIRGRWGCAPWYRGPPMGLLRDGPLHTSAAFYPPWECQHPGNPHGTISSPLRPQVTNEPLAPGSPSSVTCLSSSDVPPKSLLCTLSGLGSDSSMASTLGRRSPAQASCSSKEDASTLNSSSATQEAAPLCADVPRDGHGNPYPQPLPHPKPTVDLPGCYWPLERPRPCPLSLPLLSKRWPSQSNTPRRPISSTGGILRAAVEARTIPLPLRRSIARCPFSKVQGVMVRHSKSPNQQSLQAISWP